MLIDVTRAVSPRLAECELTHLPLDPIDVGKAIADHEHYEAALRSLVVRVVRAPDEPTVPGGVFFEVASLLPVVFVILMVAGAAVLIPASESLAWALFAFRSLT